MCRLKQDPPAVGAHQYEEAGTRPDFGALYRFIGKLFVDGDGTEEDAGFNSTERARRGDSAVSAAFEALGTQEKAALALVMHSVLRNASTPDVRSAHSLLVNDFNLLQRNVDINLPDPSYYPKGTIRFSD